MAEGLVGGALGGEEEKPEVEAPGALAGAEAFAAAVAAIASRQDPAVARDTSAFLQEQTRLLLTQRRHLDDEHALRMTQLGHQSKLLRGQRIGQGFRIAFQVAVVLLALVIIIGIAVMLHDAFTSRSVVIESFDTPASLGVRGITGKVVASALLDELTRLQAVTLSLRDRRRSLRNAWSSEVQLAVPEVGISVGEISRLLKARLGHDLHISGDVVEAPSGLELTVRGDGVAAKTFHGAAGTLDSLTTQAAEYVYAQSQPAQWAQYLATTGRYDEGIVFAREAFSRTQPSERGSLLVGLGLALGLTGKHEEALQTLRQAIALDPTEYAGRSDLIWEETILGDEEAAWRVGMDMVRYAGGRPGRVPELWYHNFDDLTGNLLAERDALVADRDSTAGTGQTFRINQQIADIEIQLHDPIAAGQALGLVRSTQDLMGESRLHAVRAELAAEAGDVQSAASEIEAAAMPCAQSSGGGSGSCLLQICQTALFEEQAGRHNKADAALGAGGHYLDCYRFRADILDQRGDWAGAQKAYAAAVALAPDLPAGYYSWGLALARHGDLAGAVAKLMDANRRGPHWADPLKAWGDVLAKQGHTKEALAKYDQALKYAPNWKQLKEARETAAKQKT
jgi:tetratricopeptide (TPR) repeat protein